MSQGSLLISLVSFLSFVCQRAVFILTSVSVADPGCLSRIPDPDFCPSRIPDLGSRILKQQQKRRGGKKNFCPTFFVTTNITKLKKFVFEMVQKKFGKIYRIPDSRVKKAPDPRSRIRIRNTDIRLVFFTWSKCVCSCYEYREPGGNGGWYME